MDCNDIVVGCRPRRSPRPWLWTVVVLLVHATLGLRAGEGYTEPLINRFPLTLEPGEREEALGPFYYQEEAVAHELTALPPLWSCTKYREIDATEIDVLYPLLTYDRSGAEYRFQIFQLFSFAGGRVSQTETNVSRFTLFPFYFQQRSPVPEKNYTAVFPFYGKLQNRLFRDEIEFVLWPVYVKTKRLARYAPPISEEEFMAPRYRYVESRRGDITTWNFLAPIFHVRAGPGLRGWQVWPLVGAEHQKTATWTNQWNEVQIEGGRESLFALWPVFFKEGQNLGTTNEEHWTAFLPFFSSLRSPLRDSTTIPWPIGLTYTVDRARRYREWDAPWPLVVFARGEGKTTSRVWPFYSRARNESLESAFLLWPIYKYNAIHAPPLDRERTRILFFLYSDTTEKNTETGQAKHRVDAWPLWTYQRDYQGNERWQSLSLLEPFFPTSKSIERNYSQLWSLMRADRNAASGAHSESLLWNLLYRHENHVTNRQSSLLFGLVQWRVGPEGRKARWLYLPAETSY